MKRFISYLLPVLLFCGFSNAAEPRGEKLARRMAAHREMNGQELRALARKASAIAEERSGDPQTEQMALSASAAALRMLQETGQIDQDEIEAEAAFLLRIAVDANRTPHLRAQAILALGDLRIDKAATALERILQAPTDLRGNPTVRSSLLALAQLRGAKAIPAISRVMATTDDSAIFGSAAHALSRIGSVESMAALAKNSGRFGDTASCHAALSGMAETILDTLKRPDDPLLPEAIWAAGRLWREDQRKRSTTLMLDLLSTAPSEQRKQALAALIAEAAKGDFEEEKEQLSAIADRIAGQPDFAEESARIRRRITAVELCPIEKSKRGKSLKELYDPPLLGNMTAMEYGDAVYRYLDVPPLPNYNHTAIYCGLRSSDGDKRIFQAEGVNEPINTTLEDSFQESFLDLSGDYYGAYIPTDATLPFAQRKAIVETAQSLVDATIAYTLFSVLEYKGGDFDGTIADIAALRCEGLVEYCYETNGLKIWEHVSYPDEWSIVNFPDRHNSTPSIFSRKPGEQLTPWSQRGAPDYSPNPNNSQMIRPSPIALPTYEATMIADLESTDVTIRATDESGIHQIFILPPGAPAWIAGPVQPQHPLSDSHSFTVQVAQEGTLRYYAVDNGGNSPGASGAQEVEVKFQATAGKSWTRYE